jgi:hypothetical protein
MSGNGISTKDSFQIAAFQAHFHINKRAGMPKLEAFGMAIAQTSDEQTSIAIAKHPNAVRQWQKTRGYKI